MSVTIKDSVHDHITVDGAAADLLDTPPVQRLRRVKQLGMTFLAYPSANHSRFEHSLGVYHLADRALAHLGVQGRQAERVRAAAMLHDVGHGPYSHTLEDLVHRETGKYHDDVGGLIESDPVATVLAAHDLEPTRVAGLVAGDGKLGQLLAGELDVDRMDYLVRDAHHTGVPYGTIDHERLVRELTYDDDELVLAEGNVQTAESLLVARALMNPTVYNHHVTRISSAMLQRAAERLLESPDVDGDRLRRMDDAELLVALRANETSPGLGTRLADRRLFKRAVWAEMADVPGDVIDADHEAIRSFEDDVADRADLDPGQVVVDVPERPSMQETTTRVLVNNEVRRLDEQSALVAALREAQRQQWRLGVYAPAEHLETVGYAAEAVMGLETDGALVAEGHRPGTRATLDEFG